MSSRSAIAEMDPDHLKLALTCRRLFLRNWRYPDPGATSRGASVNVTIFVRYEDSDSRGDEFANVVDYNVMRDALLSAGNPGAPGFIDHALDELMIAPVVLAIVEVSDKPAGTVIIESRRMSATTC
jgi:hypothetical protein